MSLQTLKDQKGFTIVELLIVIVVIGILAAITIVAFNGVQNRGKTTSANSAATALDKKAESYNAVNGQYPNTANVITGTGIQNGVTTSATSDWYSPTSSTSTQSTVLPSSAPASPNTLWYFPSGTVGGCIYYWSYTSNTIAAPITVGAPSTACATTPAATGTFPLTGTSAVAV